MCSYKKIAFLIIISFFLIIRTSKAQLHQVISDNLSEQVEILALGDPNHYEGTINTHRIGLIKELVKNKKFRVIAFESNTFEMYHSYKKFKQSKNPTDLFNGMYANFKCQELVELFDFVEEQNKKGDSIIIAGFDTNYSGSKTMEYLLLSLEKYLKNKNILSIEEKKEYFNNLEKSSIVNLRVLFMNGDKVISELIPPTKKIIAALEAAQNKTQDERFLRQQLRNILQLRENRNDEEAMSFWNRRDYYMIDNIEFLKKEYPNQKIILWGASGHFLKDAKKVNIPFFQNEKLVIIGQRLKEKYKEKYFLISYSALSGKRKVAFGNAKIDTPKENTLEYIALQKSIEEKTTFYLMNFSSQLDIPPTKQKEKINSRILGHSDTEMEIQEVCDAVIFLDNCQPYTKFKEK
ncbi:erythromycin esterase family protein [Bernardetia sp.]|uniref:erythromycin esterase family protein n=1 Tax=Bernardetia sp. TaxID=1937974 RepID=UPI0025C631B0|nr:erythromycin esterase family protein [Bernardetia sp.]